MLSQISKLPILKKEEYDIAAMEMSLYLSTLTMILGKKCFQTTFEALTISSSEGLERDMTDSTINFSVGSSGA
ncbi:hypothetical protein Tco_1335369 [Tanacetum coccineum]